MGDGKWVFTYPEMMQFEERIASTASGEPASWSNLEKMKIFQFSILDYLRAFVFLHRKP